MNDAGKQYLTFDDRQRILAACRASKHPDLHLAALLVRGIGRSPADVLRLRWRNIDILPGSCSVLFPCSHRRYKGIPVGDVTMGLLRRRAKHRRPEAWVFPDVSREAASKKLRLAWRTALKEARVAHFPIRKYAAYVDSSWGWVLQWTEVVPPDQFLRLSRSQPTAKDRPAYRVTQCVLSDAKTLSGRDCVVRSEDLIPYEQCKKVLVENWQATDEEIAMWVMHGHISIFGRDLTAVETIERRGVHHNIPGAVMADGPLSTDAQARLLSFRYDANEIEVFDPCLDRNMLAIRNEDEDRNFNHSGRFLTFNQAVGFLGKYASSVSPEGILRNAFECQVIAAFHYGAWLIQPDKTPEMYGEGYYPTVEQGLFAEGAIISLAQSELDADITRWDAITQHVGCQQMLDAPKLDNPIQETLHGSTINREKRETANLDASHVAEKEQERKIVPYKMPERFRHDWPYVIKAAIESFQEKHGYTATRAELWSFIVERANECNDSGRPSPALGGFMVRWNGESKSLTLFGSPSCARKGFGRRYNTFYRD